MNLDQRIKLAEQLADISGAVIRRYFRQANLTTETKLGKISSIVTIADQEAENAMIEILLKAAPNDGIIREEGENIPSKNGLYWVLDPIDGTSSFVKGLPIFGTLIGLVDLENNIPLLGIVNQPILKERWLGIKGQITQFNQQPVINPYTKETNSKLSEACLTSTTPLMFITEQQKAVATRLQNICQRTAFGGDCYNYLALACGWSAIPMIILEADMQYYDFCALIPILEGTGSVITDWSGHPLHKNSTEVLAVSSPFLLEQVLKAIHHKS